METLFQRIDRATPLSVKLFIPTALLVGAAVVLIFAAIYRTLHWSITRVYVELLRSAAVLVDYEFSTLGYSLKDSVEMSRHTGGVLALYPEVFRLSVYARVGDTYRVLYSNDPSQVGKLAEPHDIEPLHTGAMSVWEAADGGRNVLEVNFPLHRAGQTVATVGAYASLQERDRQLGRVLRWIVALAAGTFLSLLVLLHLAVRVTIINPLHALLDAVRRVAAEEFPEQGSGQGGDPWSVRDEVASFALALDAIVHRIRRDQEKIRELAITDPLTGLHNRRFFQEIIGRELARTNRGEGTVCDRNRRRQRATGREQPVWSPRGG